MGVVSVAVGELGTAAGFVTVDVGAVSVAGGGPGTVGGGGCARALAAVSIPDIPRRVPTHPTAICIRIRILFLRLRLIS
jgi:hypothetical protein